jgi:hypothetical protein
MSVCIMILVRIPIKKESLANINRKYMFFTGYVYLFSIEKSESIYVL